MCVSLCEYCWSTFVCTHKGSCFQTWSSQNLICPPPPPPFFVVVVGYNCLTSTKQFFKTWYRWVVVFYPDCLPVSRSSINSVFRVGGWVGRWIWGDEGGVFVLLVSFCSWNWGSPSVGWEGRVYNCFPTPVHTVIQSALLPATLAAALRLQGFQQWSLSCHEDH